MEDRPLAPGHDAILRTLLKIDEREPWPEGLIKLYWQVTTTLRRIGEAVTNKDLAWMLLFLGKPSETEPMSFLIPIKEGKVRVLDPVLVRENNEWISGNYLGMKNKKVLVAVDGGSQTEFKPTAVRLPDAREKVLIGE